jgi:hypothetical protein
MHKGGERNGFKPLVWGELAGFCQRGGIPSRPGFPLGKWEREIKNTLLPQTKLFSLPYPNKGNNLLDTQR